MSLLAGAKVVTICQPFGGLNIHSLSLVFRRQMAMTGSLGRVGEHSRFSPHLQRWSILVDLENHQWDVPREAGLIN